MNGYIKLWRSMVDWEWYKSPVVKSVFIHLLILANHAERRWMGVELKKGQFATSVESIHQATGHTTQQVRTALTKLKSTNEITIKTTNQFTLITIDNWESYQNTLPESTNEITTDSTNEQQTDNKRITTNKNIKKEKKEKKAKNNTYSETIFSYTADIGLQEALLGWIEMRNAKKKGFTIRALKLNLDKLDLLIGDKIELVDYATMKGWESFYKIPENNNQPYGKQKQSEQERIMGL